MAETDPRQGETPGQCVEASGDVAALPSRHRHEPLSAMDVVSIVLLLAGVLSLWGAGAWVAHWYWELSWPVALLLAPVAMALMGGLFQMIYIFTTLDR